MNIAPARPASRDVATGNDVGVLVYRFYRRAIPDPLLGPVFERFGVDWSRHLPKLVAYWEHVLLDRPGIATNTVGVHGGVQNVAPFGPAHIAGGSNCGKRPSTICTSVPVAELAKTRARQVGRALEAVARRRQPGATR